MRLSCSELNVLSFIISKFNLDCLPPINSRYTEAKSLASFKAPCISLPVRSILYLLQSESKLTD